MAFLSMIFHELGHTAAAAALGKKIYCIKLLPIGLNVRLEEFLCSRWEKIIIFACGPCVNILLAFVFMVLGIYFKAYSIFFLTVANIYLAVFNLLPALPLDGGKILRGFLTGWVGAISANRIMQKLSLTVSLFLIIIGTVQLLKHIFNLSLIFIGFYMFFALKPERTEAAIMNVKDVIYRRSRLLKKGVYPARDLVVVKTMHLRDIIKCLDFDRFHIIHVLDENLKLVGVFTEQDIIDAVFKYSADLTFEEFMDKNR